MREHRIEKVLKNKVEEMGGMCIKLDATYCKGIPDRLVLLPGGRLYFAELKTESGKLSPIQIHRIGNIEKMGFKVKVLKGINEVKDFINETMELSK